MLQTRLDALPKPSYYPRDLTMSMARQQMEEAIRRRQMMLPILTTTHERKLLQEAGTFAGVEYPACVNGENCVSIVLYSMIPGTNPDEKGFPCTALMFEEEYDALTTTGAKPVVIRACILCCRKTL